MKTQYLFVYGTLRPQLAHGEAKSLIAELEIIGSATVQGKLYDFGAYPGVINEKGIVYGDLLRITNSEQLISLDAYEECTGCSPLFTRSITTAQSCEGNSIAAWIYLFCGQTKSGVLIASGDYREYFRSHKFEAGNTKPTRPLDTTESS